MKPQDSNRPRSPRSAKPKAPFSYYRSPESNQRNSSPFAAAKPKKLLRKLALGTLDIILIGVIILALVYSLIIKPDSKVNASDNYRATQEYKAETDKVLSQLKNRSKITLDQKEISSSLMAKYPEIDSASVELPVFSQEPKIHLNISAPAFSLTSNGGVYIVNHQGRVVGKLTEFPNIRDLVKVNDQSGFNVQIGKHAISASGADFISQLIEQAHRAKVPIKDITLPPKAQELDLTTSDRNYYAKFILNADASQQIGQYFAARHQFDQTNSQPTEYLDVRIPGRIFYK